MIKKIFSYNVNGLRAATEKGLLKWVQTESPDILCLQETKLQHDQVNFKELEYLGYHSYFHSAEKKGYSGVALLSKTKPDRVVMGMNINRYDIEGRFIRADFGMITQICVYIPSGTMGDTRQDFKMKFLNDFTQYVLNLVVERPNLIISGDFNICIKPVDINHPEKHQKSSGFLPEERSWFDGFINHGFVDTFRVFNQQSEQYSWWSYRANARVKNLGWRIDYHLVSTALKKTLKSAVILQKIVHSDHCPVIVEMDWTDFYNEPKV
jgi:exodeoxyribonuclease-3